MSVRVNLLPGEVAERNRAARQRAAVAAGAIGFVGVLGLVYLLQLNRVGEAQDVLEVQQARVAELQSEVTDLQEFQELEQRLAATGDILAAALEDEVSFAGILQDLAAVFPSDAEVSTLSVTIPTAGEVAPELGAAVGARGVLSVTGRTVRGHAPGLERLLLELDKVAAFSNVYFSQSTVDESGASSYAVDLSLGDEIATGRYVDGLPEELR